MSYHDHSHELTRIGVSCPPRNSTTASRRDTRGGRMQTESDATCLARLLPERPSPNHPPTFHSFSFSPPYLLLFAVAISSCQTRGSFLFAMRKWSEQRREIYYWNWESFVKLPSFIWYSWLLRILINDTNHWYIKSESLLKIIAFLNFLLLHFFYCISNSN